MLHGSLLVTEDFIENKPSGGQIQMVQKVLFLERMCGMEICPTLNQVLFFVIAEVYLLKLER